MLVVTQSNLHQDNLQFSRLLQEFIFSKFYCTFGTGGVYDSETVSKNLHNVSKSNSV